MRRKGATRPVRDGFWPSARPTAGAPRRRVQRDHRTGVDPVSGGTAPPTAVEGTTITVSQGGEQVLQGTFTT